MRRGTHRYVFAVVLLAYVASRIVAAVAGVHFQDDTLFFWQLLDPHLLRDDLARSLVNLHAQPPLYNALIGLVSKVSDAPETRHAVYASLFFVLGAATHVGIAALLLRLRVGAITSAVLATLFAISPTAILYEHWLFYTWLVVAGLVAAALCLHHALRRRSRLALAGFFIAITALALTRATFHLAWIGIWVAIVIAATRALERRAALFGAIALLAVGGWYAKNLVLVGSFSGSTWLGMSLAKMTTERLEPAERKRLVASHTLDPVVLVTPFSDLSRYPKAMREPRGVPAHSALTRPRKKVGGPNLNDAAYVPISNAYARGAAWVLLHRPDVYRRAVREAWRLFLRSPAQYSWVGANRRAVGRYAGLYEEWVLGAPGAAHDGTAWTWLVLVSAGMIAALVEAWRLRRRDRASAVCLLFVVSTLVYVAVVSNFVEVGENDRFRVEIEPFAVVLVAIATTRMIGLGRALWAALRRAARGSAPDPARDRAR